MESCDWSTAPVDTTRDKSSFDQILEAEPGIRAAAVYKLLPGGGDGVICLRKWDRQTNRTAGSESDTGPLGKIDQGMLGHVAGQDEGYLISTMVDRLRSIHYCRMQGVIGPPLVLVVVSDYDLPVFPSSDIKYAIFLLFLFSTLISLLMVYLISKRLKGPINRLTRGLEKTAEGELFYVVESNGDEELNRMAKAFNDMSRTLWNNHHALKSYNVRLKKTNISLLESQTFLSTLIDSSPLSIIVTSPEGRVILTNNAASKIFNCTGEKLVGCSIEDILNPSPIRSSEDQSEYGDAPGFEALCRRNNGEQFPAYVIMAPIETVDTDARGFIYLVRDITESKNFQEMMIRLDRYSTRGEMAGDIAHEINNYLAILSGNLELIPMLLAKGNQEKVDRKLELMRSTVDKIVRFADGLMDTAQDEAHFEPANLNQVVENVLAFLKPQNKFDGVCLTVNLSPELPCLEFDQAQIQQLLVNLVNNAAEALIDHEGEKKVHVTTSVVDDGDRQFARVEVYDNGAGVNEERVEHLFKNRFTTKRKGHGIGLITCRRIVEAHNGRISYSFNNGSCFCCEMPLTRRESDTEPSESKCTSVPQS